MFTIYQINNKINQKSYIGFTIRKLQTRWKEHISSAYRGSMWVLACAIRKYGPEAFSVEVLEEGWDPEIGKNIREPYWISALNHEYNMTAGGEGSFGRITKEITKHKISEKLKGTVTYKRTPEQNAANALRNIGNKNGVGNKNSLGCIHSLAQNKAHSEYMMGRKHALKKRPA